MTTNCYELHSESYSFEPQLNDTVISNINNYH